MNEERPVDWFRSRLVAARLGALSDDDDERFRSLLRDDEQCRRAYEVFRSREPEFGPDEHLPAELIARWSKLKDAMGDSEREAVSLHLDGCTGCREELALLGHDVAPARAFGEPTGARVVRVIHEAASAASIWRQRLFAGWAAAATAAAIAIGLGVLSPERSPDSGDAPTIVTPPTRRPSTRLVLSNALRIPAPTRSGGLDTLSLHVEKSSTSFEIDVSQLFGVVGPPAGVELRLVDPSGHESVQRARSDELRSRRLVVERKNAESVAGVYSLTVTRSTSDAPIEHRVSIRVEVGP